ncbi:4-hydroxy-2-oxo-heptane-1,7-dioate aldolase [Aquimixticola soesokkakensis]|uniref:4-hydroxy-2-oxo-heptane-1,7-dioate aldolase n=1 Tax=Aquimixticola soesokkakensis TaxID=1519096 RepID=A0A1Y5RQJ8_9RHOB|nr:aldolase/citrate lyase family protein [Aquimixticola soesokkakensis]SLN22957.1 4-hydroxy-2-oxo-heptane-1,7-dioate aldolase [Aquimixticola soesokkakensis]
MTKIGRLNGVIRALEEGRKPTLAFARAEREEAVQFGMSQLDAVLFEMEHTAYTGVGLRDALQYLMNRRRMIDSGSLAPNVTPFVRLPANGAEMNQWMAKQVLDQGVFGVVWPHIATAEHARNAVAACRYARPKDAPIYEPKGARGDGPINAARYWGLSVPEYYERADVWPLDPKGEIMVVLMIESVEAMENLEEILKVPGVGAIMIGEGDLSQQLGYARQYEHPVVVEAKAKILAAGKAAGVPVAHPHVTGANVEQVIAEGYSILFTTPSRNYATLEKAKSLM